MSLPFHHNAKQGTKDFAKELRQRQTSAEELFWKMVRNRRMLGLKIRRQHPIGKYIVDFYCHELQLVIELDGSIHNLEHVRKKDKIRDAFLKAQGLTIFRVDNVFVYSNPHVIEEEIAKLKNKLISPNT